MQWLLHHLVCLSLQYIFSALVVAAASSQPGATDDDNKQVYIVYMGSLPTTGSEYTPQSHHISILQQVVEGRSAVDFLVRSYNRSFNGFAARISSDEGHKISGMSKVVSVFPSKTLHFHTTRSWDFIGFTEDTKSSRTGESDVIIGVIDSGIWPESESFCDQGFGPPPQKWKGQCAGGENFICNNKIIGARFYDNDRSARDNIGHGSHTASIAAGNKVSRVSFYGMAKGNARGRAPSARIAVYKPCDDSCSDQQVLAAFDDAIADGVDIITISLGGGYHQPFENDAVAIGAFHAMEKGILTVHSAGNFGNEKTLVGLGVNSFVMSGKFPLIFGSDSDKCARTCSDGYLDSKIVKGNIVLCESDMTTCPFDEPLSAGAVGAIALGTNADNSTSYIDP
ncbi:hypothetical protein JRO89_XS01G0111500 [Xanthoceras sorbifolium]|uniref:Cucumisin n=1 Tax=Xanthoceras sorbifolium TaxID=99658 RepID=A0ABQ8IIR7_9ROSI|nr:hypothetical protein JRO89_XS01G0111500 [Xanthoceras sorbifolium]